jgi:hypothetical protein
MRAMTLRSLFSVTAAAEAGTGLALLFLPAVPIALLLGVEQAAPEALLVGRVAGAGLLALGVASWLARNDQRSPAQRGLLTGMLIYNAAVTVLLAVSGTVLRMTGIALWPAVVLHTALACWCSYDCVMGKEQ